MGANELFPVPDFRLRFVVRVSSPQPSASPFETNSENMVAISRGCNGPFTKVPLVPTSFTHAENGKTL